ncbi:MAG: GTP 3',8-cyclase MoaA [Solobacterium sp.]|nr:GTP 3',8-cyclase MoaA [Solobacterium sp.]
MIDSFGRKIDYLRISVTDLCNLRCVYCMPEGTVKTEMSEILTFEEIAQTVRAAAACGITKIRLTGGEPTVRKDIVSLVRMLSQIEGIEEIRMTSNGILLSEMASDLKAAGLCGVNISLDTLNAGRFKKIAGTDALEKVMAGIQASLDAGLCTKINTVLQKGVNDDEWQDLIRLSENRKLDVRFIELMPIGQGRYGTGIDNDELLQKISQTWPRVTPDESFHGNGPARYVHIDGFMGSTGFISAIHGKFCHECNRLRLTSKGLLKPCLCYGDSVEIKSILRQCPEEERHEKLVNAFTEAVKKKPEAHCFEKLEKITEQKKMSEIGG